MNTMQCSAAVPWCAGRARHVAVSATTTVASVSLVLSVLRPAQRTGIVWRRRVVRRHDTGGAVATVATEAVAGPEVTYEVRLAVCDGSDEQVEAVLEHTAPTVQAAREWVLSHATITKVVRKAVG